MILANRRCGPFPPVSRDAAYRNCVTGTRQHTGSKLAVASQLHGLALRLHSANLHGSTLMLEVQVSVESVGQHCLGRIRGYLLAILFAIPLVSDLRMLLLSCLLLAKSLQQVVPVLLHRVCILPCQL